MFGHTNKDMIWWLTKAWYQNSDFIIWVYNLLKPVSCRHMAVGAHNFYHKCCIVTYRWYIWIYHLVCQKASRIPSEVTRKTAGIVGVLCFGDFTMNKYLYLWYGSFLNAMFLISCRAFSSYFTTSSNMLLLQKSMITLVEHAWDQLSPSAGVKIKLLSLDTCSDPFRKIECSYKFLV